MVFKNQQQLENYLLSRCKLAVAKAENKIYGIIRDYLQLYYDEYEPAEYQRTWQFFDSLVHTGVKKTARGYEAEVYFDFSKVHYPEFSTGKSGNLIYNPYSTERILINNLTSETSPHGIGNSEKCRVYGAQIGVWVRAEFKIKYETLEYLKEALIANGIPIR